MKSITHGERHLLIGKLLRRIAEGDTSFAHEPLKTNSNIRLFELEPGKDQEPFKGSLKQVPISRLSAYHALSYTWGKKEAAPHIIWIDDVECFVRQNLWEALNALRHPANKMVLWIDALCIDQENVFERSHQVRMMDQIYCNAQVVHVWLGPHESEDEKAFMFMHSLEGGNTLSTHQLITTSRWKAAVTSLLSRRYWRRAWISQEFVLASNMLIHCGNGSVPWSFLDRSCYTLRSDLPKDVNHAVHLIEQRRLRHSTPIQLTESLESLLFKHADKECEEGRDRIFALLSFANGCENGEGIQADYSMCAVQLLFHILHFCQSPNVARLALLLCQSLEISGDPHGKIEQDTCSQCSIQPSALGMPTLANTNMQSCWSLKIEILGELSNQSSYRPASEDCYHSRVQSRTRDIERVPKPLHNCQQAMTDDQNSKLVCRLIDTELVVIFSSSSLSEHLQSRNEEVCTILEAEAGFLGLSLHPSICCVDKHLRLVAEVQIKIARREISLVRLSCTDLARLCHRYYQRRSGIHYADESFPDVNRIPSEAFGP